ncbi:MAG: HAMP domain-containing sensor histidine kinase [Candidatus Moranbacteria bacterium]|nr:HAMP domain-containing sensor histidine kinase [Candidatus Moranbacteria bacterium]
MFSKFLSGINFIARCRKYGLGLWECPNFLFIVMGVVTIVTMVGTYFLSRQFSDEGITIMSVTVEAVLIVTIGSFVISGVEKVAEANILKTEFVSIISHQLCTPLSAIKWSMEVLETEREADCKFSEKQKMFLGNIKKSNEQMLKMVTDLLEVARIDQGRAIFEDKELDLSNLVEESVAGLMRSAKEKNVQISLRIEPGLSRVCVDERKIKVVLDNLIGNAVKYSKNGGKVEVGLKEENRRIVFSVQDWGVGIPKFQHSRVFEKFFRSRNDSRYRTDGVGIGLYLAKAILKHCGGEVWFDSEAEKGSTFYFRIPVPAAKNA